MQKYKKENELFLQYIKELGVTEQQFLTELEQ